MSKNNNKKLFSSLHLRVILNEKGYEINDLKAEAVLMMFENFVKHYIEGEERGNSKLILENEDSKGKNSYILERLKTVRSKLLKEAKIFTLDTLTREISKSLLMASKYSPYTLLYNLGVQTYLKERERLFKGEQNLMWIPDVLAVYLIVDAKENGISFDKFPIIHNEDFEDILSIFAKTNIELKKLTNEKKTIITKTSSISATMISRIVNAK